ncbi:MAG TPA: lyase family protein [Saprospiraceae bacterium]|nr:lyase family protein [Saprospiraceae bacterium]HNT22453.1 lyase family protein [Saprospiraceae bacterium]
MPSLYSNLFYDRAFEFFEVRPVLEALLGFEKALARVQSRQGLIPPPAAGAIEILCSYESINRERLMEESARSGNILIPLLGQCRQLLAGHPSEAAGYLHFLATSQDAIDTAAMIQYKKATAWINLNLRPLITGLVEIAEMHRHTPMAGRTFMQHARPITFGFKVAGWIDGLLMVSEGLRFLKFPLQLGGSVGTAPGYSVKQYEEVSSGLSRELGLDLPVKPWHNQRQYIHTMAHQLGALQGHLNKMATDLSLLAQNEVGEISFDGKDKGHSSIMPHKTNPVNAILILANGLRIQAIAYSLSNTLTQDHERGSGPWHAEWESMEDLFRLVAGSLRLSIEMIGEIRVNKERMLKNIDDGGGLVFAEHVSRMLSLKLNTEEAQALVRSFSTRVRSTGESLQALLLKEESLRHLFSEKEISSWFEIENNLGLCDYFTGKMINRAKDLLSRKFKTKS